MKTKILLLFAISFCVIIASRAQINAGKYLIGGSFNMYSQKNTQSLPGSKIKTLYSNIQFGKVIKENTIVGVILSYGFSNYYYPSSFADTTKVKQYTAGVFYRKYKKLANKFNLFGEADAVYAHIENRENYSNQNGSKSISDGGSASFAPGISYAIWKKLQVELLMPDIISLSYFHEKKYNDSDPIPGARKGNTFSINTSLNGSFLSSFAIGFKFIL